MMVPVYQALPFEVTVKRWFQSKEIWTYIAGQVLVVGPIALNSLASLGLSSSSLLIWTVVVQVALANAGIWLKNQSSAVIGAKSDVDALTPTVGP